MTLRFCSQLLLLTLTLACASPAFAVYDHHLKGEGCQKYLLTATQTREEIAKSISVTKSELGAATTANRKEISRLSLELLKNEFTRIDKDPRMLKFWGENPVTTRLAAAHKSAEDLKPRLNRHYDLITELERLEAHITELESAELGISEENLATYLMSWVNLRFNNLYSGLVELPKSAAQLDKIEAAIANLETTIENVRYGQNIDKLVREFVEGFEEWARGEFAAESQAILGRQLGKESAGRLIELAERNSQSNADVLKVLKRFGERVKAEYEEVKDEVLVILTRTHFDRGASENQVPTEFVEIMKYSNAHEEILLENSDGAMLNDVAFEVKVTSDQVGQRVSKFVDYEETLGHDYETMEETFDIGNRVAVYLTRLSFFTPELTSKQILELFFAQSKLGENSERGDEIGAMGVAILLRTHLISGPMQAQVDSDFYNVKDEYSKEFEEAELADEEFAWLVEFSAAKEVEAIRLPALIAKINQLAEHEISFHRLRSVLAAAFAMSREHGLDFPSDEILLSATIGSFQNSSQITDYLSDKGARLPIRNTRDEDSDGFSFTWWYFVGIPIIQGIYSWFSN